VHLVLVHVSRPNEAIHTANGVEPGYHELPTSGEMLSSLAAATSGSVFSEGSLGAAIRAERAAVGRGPTVGEGRSERTTTLAPYAALASLIPLAFVLLRGVTIRRRRPSAAPRAATAAHRPSPASQRSGAHA
jgi:hypothetical protein